MIETATLVILADSRVVFSGTDITADMAREIAADIKEWWLAGPATVLVLRGPVNVIDLRKPA